MNSLINSTPLSPDVDHTAERRAVVTAVFAATGKKVDEDDPIIVAALFQAYTMREATRHATGQIAEVGGTVKLAVDDLRRAALDAGAVTRKAASDEKKRADALEARVIKALRESGRTQARAALVPAGWHGVAAGLAAGVLIAGCAVTVACGFSLSWFSDARLGAEFRRSVPVMDPSLREKLLDHLEKGRA